MAERTADYDKTHRRNLTTIAANIDRIYAKAVKEAAKIGMSLTKPLSDGRIFSFDDFPKTHKQINGLLNSLAKSVEALIVNGIRSEWTLSNNKNNALARRLFGDNVGKLSAMQYRRYFSTNGAALDAFIGRKERGMNLSDRVWHYTDLFKREIELGLDVGIRNGLSASAMARELQQYLQHPDMLFRRIRDEHGNLQLSKAAKAFHPGQGVYRSSYRNAKRLAVTETNMAYRTADHLRWQQMDFVVGIEVRLSGNHTCLGRDGKPHAFHDICDELKGRYPKDFKFTGWHPNCRCYAISILKTEEEMAEDTRRILAGEEPIDFSDAENAVTAMPDNFNGWLTENAERIERAEKRGTLPYFIRNNAGVIDDILHPGESQSASAYTTPKRSIEEIAAERHAQRTSEKGGTTGIKSPLTPEQKQRRAEIRQQARDTIADKPIVIPGINKPATISRDKIKEWLNQPHTHIDAKNESLLHLSELLKSGQYIGCGVDTHDPTAIAHLVRVKFSGDDSWVVIRELNDGSIRIHSISDNPSIVDKIIKKKP